jgi:hypothetical protein
MSQNSQTAIIAALDNPILATTEEERQAELMSVVERVAIIGDLALLHPADRVRYYARLCESLGLNPLTRPFEFISLNNKLTLYPRRDTTDQLRVKRGVSIDKVERLHDAENALAIVTTWGSTRDGRTDQAQGLVSLAGLKGEALANAWMKAETKSKRRLTLSLVGLGMLDETEVFDTPGAQRVEVDPDDGTIKQLPRPVGASRTEQVRGLLEQQVADPVLAGDELKKALGGIHAAGKKRGLDHDGIHAIAAGLFDWGEGTEHSLNDLTRGEWDRLDDALASIKPNEQPQESTPSGDAGSDTGPTPPAVSTPAASEGDPGKAPSPSPAPTVDEAAAAFWKAAVDRKLPGVTGEWDADWAVLNPQAAKVLDLNDEAKLDDLDAAGWVGLRDRVEAGEFDAPRRRTRSSK